MKFSLFYIYIYIYMCVCVCVCMYRVNDAGDARKLLFSIIYIYKSIVFLYFRS